MLPNQPGTKRERSWEDSKQYHDWLAKLYIEGTRGCADSLMLGGR